MLGFLLGCVCGFIIVWWICAVLVAGRVADLESEIAQLGRRRG